MRTIQMTLADDLVNSVDLLAKKLHTSRSAFTREALREAIKRFQQKELELKHRIGYEKHPVNADEFSAWEAEQEWGGA